MSKLILFDIDGTLLTGWSEERFTRTINNLYNLGITSDKNFSGNTDYLILVELLENVGWEAYQIQAAMPALIKELDRVHKESFDLSSMTILPGVKKLLTALKEHGITMGLITGNLEPIARRKHSLGRFQGYASGARCT